MQRDATEFGAGGPHDTERPDIITASDAYAYRRFHGAIGGWLLGEQTRTIGALLDRAGPARLRILDVGGGHAQLTPLFVERGHDVVVHGSDRSCFGRVAPFLQEHASQVTACVSTLRQLPFADRQFDLVVAVRLFGHVERWQELIGEMARVSRRWVMIEFARAHGAVTGILPGISDVIFDLKRFVEKTTRPFFAYREEALVSALLAHHFRVVTVDGQFALPMVMHRMGRSPRLSRAIEEALRAAGVGSRFRSPAVLLAERMDTAVGTGNGNGNGQIA